MISISQFGKIIFLDYIFKVCLQMKDLSDEEGKK